MKSVAVVGASNDRRKYGNRAVRAYVRQGYRVYPVNPRESEIEGLRAYASVRDLPERPDRVTIYLQPEATLAVLAEIAERGCDEVWLNPGSESEAALEEAARLGLRVVQACSILDVGEDPESL